MSADFSVKEILVELMKETKEQSKALTNIDSHLAKLNSKVASHELYLANLDGRIVEERKHREEIKEDINEPPAAATFIPRVSFIM